MSGFRNDGKRRRQPRLGLPKGTPPPATPVEAREPSLSWHELVQPGPKGFPAKTYERREALGQVVHLNPKPDTIARPARQGGAVRLGLYRVLHPHKTGQHAPSERLRTVKGNRQPGWVEVREGNVREGMAKIRNRPVSR
jgi:hypothetical protein